MSHTLARDAEPLSLRLRSRTTSAHTEAEESVFLADLLSGKLALDSWYHLIEQYWYIYGALEGAAVKFRDSGPLADLISVKLDRLSAIEQDLDTLGARLSATSVGLLPATAHYVDRILDSAQDAPRYLAHHYVRYLGDLSGGRVMRVWLERHYGLAEEEQHFFRFERIPKPVPFKNEYRRTLDALPFTPAEQTRLVNEAVASFTANSRIFAELQAIARPQGHSSTR